jgi:hypothetical protein
MKSASVLIDIAKDSWAPGHWTALKPWLDINKQSVVCIYPYITPKIFIYSLNSYNFNF